MSYVASQILLFIIVAVVFGFAVGWTARARRGVPRKGRRRF